MADTIQLEVATSERQIVKDSVSEVQIPGKDGYLGILPGHAPLLGLLGTGTLIYSAGGQKRSVAIQGGFIEVQPDQVRVLADTAERGEDVNVAKAKEDLSKAESQLTSDPDKALPAAALAQARIDAAKR